MRVGLIINPHKLDASEFVPGFVAWLASRGHEPLLAAGSKPGIRAKRLAPARLVQQSDLVVALGGDGTLLYAARLVSRSQKPIMGVNLGGLGFLTEFSTAEARGGINAFARGQHAEERRMVLACRCGTRRGHALNDCAVNMGPNGRVIEVIARAAAPETKRHKHQDAGSPPGIRHSALFVNRFVGDGVVVATPTGSTAYSLAAGGPVVYPTMEAMLLTPLAPHALAARPLILPADTRLELELARGSDPAVLNLDGQSRWRIAPGRPVLITRADFCVRLVTPRKRTYYSILRDKMKWSGSQV